MGREEGERHSFLFFFFKEKKCNLEEEKKFRSDPKMGYETAHHFLPWEKIMLLSFAVISSAVIVLFFRASKYSHSFN
jgi:hypothetical protein